MKEVNNALINLIQNPECDFEDIYCAPDFATGAILLNEKDVKESLKNGTGSACKLRSVVEYDSKERCFIVTEIPFGVYTSTICSELDAIIEDENNPGIEKYNDLTGKTPLIKIYLARKINPDKALRFLFKNTSLQSWYSINMTMLDNGRYPRVFTWREALQTHIDHEKVIYRNSYNYDLRKMEDRVHILEGLLTCLASIDEVVATIKASSSAAEAKKQLQTKFLLDDVQAKAVLDLKLSKLAHLEVEKLTDEKKDLEGKINHILSILNDEALFNNELIKGWQDVIKRFGDLRRTRIVDLGSEEEPTEIRSLQISLSNKNNLYITESSTLYSQRRGGVGNKVKMEKDEYIRFSIPIETNEEILFFTDSGVCYSYPARELTIDVKTPLEALIPLENWENICAISSTSRQDSTENIIFVTRQGLVKKSKLSDYNTKRSGGLKALSLEKDDYIVNVIFTNNSKIGILTEQGNFVIISTEDIRTVGRVAKGIHGIKLNEGDFVSAAKAISEDTKYIVSISSNGLFKKTPYDVFSVQGKNTKGSKLQKLVAEEIMISFSAISDEKEVLISSNDSTIKVSLNEIPELSRGAQGTKAIKLSENSKIVEISKY